MQHAGHITVRRKLIQNHVLQAIVHGNSMFESSDSIPNPPIRPVGSIPDCTMNLFLTPDCLDFVYAPNNVSVVNARSYLRMTCNMPVLLCSLHCLLFKPFIIRVAGPRHSHTEQQPWKSDSCIPRHWILQPHRRECL